MGNAAHGNAAKADGHKPNSRKIQKSKGEQIMALKIVRICSGCGEDFPKLERQLDGKDYCSTDCFMDYNSPCEGCGDAIPIGEGIHYKEEGYTLCWECAAGTD